MSVTGMLRYAGTPLYRFLDEHFNKPARLGDPVGIDYSKSIKRSAFRPGPILIETPRVEGVSDGVAGHAFDYRVRYLIEWTDPFELVAAKGASALRWELRRNSGFKALASAITNLRPDPFEPGRLLADAQERELTRYCIALGHLEEAARAKPDPDWAIVKLGKTPSVDDLLTLVHEETVDDVQAMLSLMLERHPELISESTMLNPTFDASNYLGGADGDLIVDGMLLDLKTTRNPKMERRKGPWQLIAYVLADYDDRLGITHAGFYYARFGLLLKWDIDDLIARPGDRGLTVVEARRLFKEMLTREFGLREEHERANQHARSRAEAQPKVFPRAVAFFKPVSSERALHGRVYRTNSGGQRVAELLCGRALKMDWTSLPIAVKEGDSVRGLNPQVCDGCRRAACAPGDIDTAITDDERNEWIQRSANAAARRFYPPSRGSGKHHLALRDAPWNNWNNRPGDLSACGAAIRLDLEAIGSPREGGAVPSERFCRHCLHEAYREDVGLL